MNAHASWNGNDMDDDDLGDVRSESLDGEDDDGVFVQLSGNHMSDDEDDEYIGSTGRPEDDDEPGPDGEPNGEVDDDPGEEEEQQEDNEGDDGEPRVGGGVDERDESQHQYDIFKALERKWKIRAGIRGMEDILAAFGIATDADFVPATLQDVFEADLRTINVTCGQLLEHELDAATLVRRKDCLLKALFSSRESAMAMMRASQVEQQYPAPVALEDLFWFNSNAEEDLLTECLPYHRLLLYLLGKMFRNRWRRHDGCAYQQVTVEGHETHAWEKYADMPSLVRMLCTKETAWDYWKIAHTGCNLDNAAKYLIACCDFEFPDLQMSRRIWSFGDGVYEAHTDMFTPYTDMIEDSVTACKLFKDHTFAPVYLNARNSEFLPPQKLSFDEIHTPLFDSIMTTQHWDASVMWWMYVFIGRMFYEVNEADHWQVMPFFKGTAGSGKSTIIRVVEMMYNHVDIGVISNTIEPTFGMSMVFGKLVCLMPEIDSKFKLDRTLFQSCVTGERGSFPVKNGTAIIGEWKPPMMAAGNEFITNWDLKSGAIPRRIVTFPFNYKVPEDQSDPFLLDNIRDYELAGIIRKSAIAYNDAVRVHTSGDIWGCLPQMLREEKVNLQFSTCPLFQFLRSEEIEPSPDDYILEKEFITRLKEYSKSHFASKAIVWNSDFFSYVFNDMQLTIRRSSEQWPPSCNTMITGNFIYGIKLVS
jgi:hypothetical protein